MFLRLQFGECLRSGQNVKMPAQASLGISAPFRGFRGPPVNKLIFYCFGLCVLLFTILLNIDFVYKIGRGDSSAILVLYI